MISEKLKKVILEELELEAWDIHDRTTAGTVPGWDSLSHVRIISAVEAAYGIRFKISEIVRLRDVGQLQGLIHART
jgi:acyl carrier protein